MDDSKIRSQDSVAVINSIAQNPSGRIAAWQFVKEKYNELFKRFRISLIKAIFLLFYFLCYVYFFVYKGTRGLEKEKTTE